MRSFSKESEFPAQMYTAHILNFSPLSNPRKVSLDVERHRRGRKIRRHRVEKDEKRNSLTFDKSFTNVQNISCISYFVIIKIIIS